MFGISFLEISIIVILMILFFSPKDIISTISIMKNTKDFIIKFFNEANTFINNEINKAQIEDLKKQTKETLNARDSKFYEELTSIKNDIVPLAKNFDTTNTSDSSSENKNPNPKEDKQNHYVMGPINTTTNIKKEELK